MTSTTIAVSLAIVLFTALPAAAAPVDDAYIAGYATAVIERQFPLPGSTVSVKDGVVTVTARKVAAADREKVTAALSGIRGVVRVEIVEPPPSTPTTAAPQRTPPLPEQDDKGVKAEIPSRGLVVFPKGYLFDPLLADPRWPHFSVAYQRYMGDRQLENVGAANFGETFALLRNDAPFGGQWEVGLQAGVFAIFDLDASSTDLINADYFVGVPLSYRIGDLSALARIFHQSSHLGDEFLLRSRADRVNLSYEGVDLKLSYQFGGMLRVYGGGGYLFRTTPSDLKPWSAQAGVELRSPWALLDGALRPVAALDVQSREENDWSSDVSLRAGVQFENLPMFNRKLQLMLEYFHGHSPNGQFYREKIEYLGVGLHLYVF